MIPEDILALFRSERDRHYRTAQENFQRVSDHVRLAQNDLNADPPRMRRNVGGSVLHSQYWDDAERALVRYWDAAGVVAILAEANAAAEMEAAQDPDVVMADEFFEDREPGSVQEAEYQKVLDGIRNARNYLTHEQCYRVQYNVRWGMNERVSWVEATSEEDARGDETKLPVVSMAYGRTQVRIVSCRRATVDDLNEFVQGIAEEERWGRE